MVGRPRKRAQRMAAAIQEGRDPESWTDDRPMKKEPQRERGWGIIREKQQAGLRGPSRASAPPGEVDDEAIQVLLGGLTADDLDAESSVEFEALRRLGFAFAREVMELPLSPTDKNFAKILAVKLAITQTVFTATTRVRPGDLREQDDDGVGALLEEVRREGADSGAETKLKTENPPRPDAVDDAAQQAAARAALFS